MANESQESFCLSFLLSFPPSFLPLLFGLPPLLEPAAERPGWKVAKVGDERAPHSTPGATVAGSVTGAAAAAAGGETETVVAVSEARKASIGGILT